MYIYRCICVHICICISSGDLCMYVYMMNVCVCKSVFVCVHIYFLSQWTASKLKVKRCVPDGSYLFRNTSILGKCFNDQNSLLYQLYILLCLFLFSIFYFLYNGMFWGHITQLETRYIITVCFKNSFDYF